MKTFSVSALVVIFGTSATLSPNARHGFPYRDQNLWGMFLVGFFQVDFFLTQLVRLSQTQSDSSLICKGICSMWDNSSVEKSREVSTSLEKNFNLIEACWEIDLSPFWWFWWFSFFGPKIPDSFLKKFFWWRNYFVIFLVRYMDICRFFWRIDCTCLGPLCHSKLSKFMNWCRNMSQKWSQKNEIHQIDHKIS